MIKIAIISHGNLGAALIDMVCSMAQYKENDVAVFSVSCHIDVEQLASDFRKYLEDNRENGVLVLADIFGGSGCNISLLASRDLGCVEVVSGINLAMLISALQNLDKLELKELAAKVEADAKRSIVNATTFLAAKQ
ncbi:mannose/fructose-specific phosphotransferase system component IIA [Elusimicrobium posterum]|uniref:PTS sugar transporter subunit IIA n=1 Tax=Elusimicrobium posterum TaxID=3116653 RepID=UPI003C74BDF5